MTFSALLLVLFVLVPSPALAKGPQQVEVRNVATGTKTMLTWDRPEMMALMELAEWPADRRKPHLVANGGVRQVATLAWQFEGGQSVWVDRVFSNGNGKAWIARTDHLSGNTFETWGMIRAPFALDLLLAELGEVPGKTRTAATATTSTPRTSQARASEDGFDGTSFGWGAGAAALLAGTLSLGFSRRRTGRA